ncbi:phage tail protein [Myxococcus stipitatus]|uniref:phage tail protein n=1 Tax=Myxococcus stipitatus TaxID=83455 RepID=UPI001F182444|nr:phage tail protein [Myxococcus stipitatus]MCE9670520.1 phage tail protein [Myxococcus stipitatus]
MDANRLRFWLLAEPLVHWEPLPEGPSQPHAIHRDTSRRTVRLASSPGTVPWTEPDEPARAEQLVNQVPGTLDAFGTWAYLDEATATVMAAGAGPEPTPLLRFDATTPRARPTDLVLGEDGVLYVAAGGGKVLLSDTRNRWDPATVSLEGFEAWRLAPAPGGGVFVLGRPTSLGAPSGPAQVRLAHVTGQPLHRGLPGERAPTVFNPEDNRNPPRMSLLLDGPSLPGEVLVGLATSPDGRLALLSWVHDAASAVPPGDGSARLRFFTGTGVTEPVALLGARRPFSLAWVRAERVAVLLRTGATTLGAVAYEPQAQEPLAAPLGDYYPLTAHDGGPFLHGPHAQVHYPVQAGAPEPLHPVSLPSFALQGSMRNAGAPLAPLLDAGDARAVWHRLYLEACLPPRCGLRVFLAATSTAQRPAEDAEDTWHEHLFGDVASTSGAAQVPRGAWVSDASELPFHPGLLPGTPEPGRRGLFTVLIQRAGRRVRALQGRYLWVRVQLVGDGRSSPEVAALRVHGPRFSYAENYLPELYREQVFGDDADAKATSTPADFLERFLGLTEGLLTPIEDRIAGASLLTDPRTVPEESLEWLAGWIGLTFDAAIPHERRRRLLEAAPRIRPWRGTSRGLRLALDALTDGGISRGGLVVVEEYRLRRTFSTLLGIDLGDEDDPLLPGLHQSGNSYVGDTLFLGSEDHKEFLALFGPEAPTTAAEEAAVEQFLAGLAHRVTVLVHQDLDARELGLVQRVAELEAPAHVAVSVKRASHPLMVGVASLVGIDTYLGPPPSPQPLRVGEGALGSRNLLERPPSLDPRLLAGG